MTLIGPSVVPSGQRYWSVADSGRCPQRGTRVVLLGTPHRRRRCEPCVPSAQCYVLTTLACITPTAPASHNSSHTGISSHPAHRHTGTPRDGTREHAPQRPMQRNAQRATEHDPTARPNRAQRRHRIAWVTVQLHYRAGGFVERAAASPVSDRGGGPQPSQQYSMHTTLTESVSGRRQGGRTRSAETQTSPWSAHVYRELPLQSHKQFL